MNPAQNNVGFLFGAILKSGMTTEQCVEVFKWQPTKNILKLTKNSTK
ncbi:MAG: hypothetical protein BMS9Abin08_0586 [Gammaproteobacteria bacterium]|nr:MAG: hypothetical protein BMS9Abin08_0586 [Gammaproteobacteria bacterium]